MAHSTDIAWPVRRNLAIAGGLAAAAVVQYVALPLWLLPLSPAWGWLMLPLVLLTPTWWALMHEAFHGLLHPDRRTNVLVGRALAIAFAAPFRILRFGHLMHHRHNRTALDRCEVMPGGRPGAGDRGLYYLRLVIGLYLAEAASAALALAPRRLYERVADAAFGAVATDGRSMATAAARQLKSAPARREIRGDGVLVLALLGGSFLLYGGAWWLLALGLAGRGLLQSLLDNAYHYATPLDDRLNALNLRLPWALERFCLNFTLHGIHHRRPGLPWTMLPGAFAAAGGGYDGDLLVAVLKQFRGPIPAADLVARPPASDPTLQAVAGPNRSGGRRKSGGRGLAHGARSPMFHGVATEASVVSGRSLCDKWQTRGGRAASGHLLVPTPSSMERQETAPLASAPNRLIIREAESPLEIEAAQALRYQVFYNEMGAIPSPEARRMERDYDRFDDYCDHLLAIDPARSNGRPFVAGCYRLLRGSVAHRHEGFYTADEFDISSLVDYPGEVVEVGRSCVHPDYRTRGVMQQLWGGIADYLKRYHIGVLFGCASFPGTDPESMTEQLSYLHHFHLAPADLRPRALDHRYVDMAKLSPSWLDERKAITALPPLIKGYVRLGGFVGDGAVIDYQFNTTDVCIIVQTEHISAKYHRHYRPSATL